MQTLHYISPHFTQLHFTALIDTSLPLNDVCCNIFLCRLTFITDLNELFAVYVNLLFMQKFIFPQL
jgi:hypothetical protein